jgi:molybdopterin-containing oxidoreductase family membrane subunit
VAGAIYSGIGMVLTLLIPLRKVLKLEHMMTDYHFDNLGKLTLLTGSILFYAYAMEYFVAWYSGNAFEQATFWRRAFGPMWWAGWSMIICNAFVSQLLWFGRSGPISRALHHLVFVNLGMWFERFVPSPVARPALPPLRLAGSRGPGRTGNPDSDRSDGSGCASCSSPGRSRSWPSRKSRK